MKHNHHSSKISRLLKELDWDCQDHMHYHASLSILHWYPASFITSIPGNIIDIFTEPGDVVWDPFCGAGTSALEAFRKGRSFYGNDISEIAVRISRAKLQLLRNKNNVDKIFDKLISELYQLEFNISFNIPQDHLVECGKENCSFDELKPWYNKKTLAGLLVLYGFLNKYKNDKNFKDIFTLLFLSIAKVSCAQKKTWGHIADNVLPDDKQIEVNNYDVISHYIRRLNQAKEEIKKILIVASGSKYRIELADTRKYSPPSSVDIVITSPPYPSMSDYITAQRLDYYWLGYNKNDINTFKKEEIGARYLRHNGKKNSLYIASMKESIDNINRYVKNGGLLVFALPIYNGKDARKEAIDELYEFIGKRLNLLYRIPRNIDENNRWAPFRSLKTEELSIWSKK